MARLVLVGLPGVGKTSVAEKLADLWGCQFVDTDELVAAVHGKPTAEILREDGESVFRDLELAALSGAVDLDAVIATGGGVVTTPRARELLRRSPTIWLDCGDAEIVERAKQGDRPLLGTDVVQAIATLRSLREAWYAEVSRARVDASGTLDDVVERVLRAAIEVAT